MFKHAGYEDDVDFVHPLELARQQKAFSNRRRFLKTAGGIFLASAALIGCNQSATFSTSADSTDSSGSSDTSDSSSSVGSGTCSTIPTETKGPYPLDGSNGTNALSSIYRQNIVGSDIASTSGVTLNLNLEIVKVSSSCVAVSNAAVYIWHCDQSGQYSGYSSSQNGYHYGKTFCRGIHVTDSSGAVSFTTVYPGWYAGRITHIHVAVYLNNNFNNLTKVSQIALPQDVTRAVYAVSPYSTKGQNTSVTSFSADNIFSDGVISQLATVSGSVNTGYTASLRIGV